MKKHRRQDILCLRTTADLVRNHGLCPMWSYNHQQTPLLLYILTYSTTLYTQVNEQRDIIGITEKYEKQAWILHYAHVPFLNSECVLECGDTPTSHGVTGNNLISLSVPFHLLHKLAKLLNWRYLYVYKIYTNVSWISLYLALLITPTLCTHTIQTDSLHQDFNPVYKHQQYI